MSGNLVPDGTYKIYNVQYSASVLNLTGGSASAALTGYSTPSSSNNLKWKVKNIGNNQIVIESVSVPGIFANVPVHLSYVGLTASPNPTIWTVISAGTNIFRISVYNDGQEYYCYLPGGTNDTVVLLGTNIGGSTAHWSFKSA